MFIRYNRRIIIGNKYMQVHLIKKSKVLFVNQNKIAVLIHSIKSTAEMSFSFVLSMAEFINSVHLSPPNVNVSIKHKKETNYKTGKYDNERPLDYFQAWADYFFMLLSEANILNTDESVIFIGDLDKQHFQEIQNCGLFDIKTNPSKFQDLEIKLSRKEIISLLGLEQIRNQKSRKIGIINFSASVLNQDKLKPKIHIDGILSGILFNKGDIWHSFKILKGEIPTVEDLRSYDTIILSGSSFSVNSLADEMVQFRDILIRSLHLNKKLKVVGICFGHQFIAHSNNIPVITKPLKKGSSNIHFKPNNQQIEYFKELQGSQLQHLTLYKYHSDHVTSIPPGFIGYANSDHCEIESLVSQDKRILTFQSHPEYTAQYISSYEKKLDSYNKMENNHPRHQLDLHHHNSIQILRRVIRRFINWNH